MSDTELPVQPRSPFHATQLRLLAVCEDVEDSSLLLHTGFQLRHPDLYEEALKAFGSWEAVLAEMVLLVRDKEKVLNPEELEAVLNNEVQAPIDINRERADEADQPLYGLSLKGDLFRFEGDELPLTHAPYTPEAEWATHFGPLATLQYTGRLGDLFVFSKSGLYFGVVHDFLPQASAPTQMASLLRRLDLPEGDSIGAVLARRDMEINNGRLLHVTQKGKGKASALSDFPHMYGKQGKEAFLLKEDDIPIAVLAGKTYNGLFCASAKGQGIHMDAQDIRTMGRKSVGVNVMKLSGSDDAVVSAFLTEGVHQLAVLTEQGFAKRIPFHEFRQQGRGGSGMQLLRLNADDRVVGTVPVDANDDLFLCTNLGRQWRLPAYLFEEMGRAARGKRLFEPQTGETIIGFTRLPCAGTLEPLTQDPPNDTQNTTETQESPTNPETL